jgi:hypothetical protein
VKVDFADGNAIAAFWNKRQSYWTKKWKNKSPRHRPLAVARPPLPAVPALQPPALQPPPPVLPPNPALQAEDEAVQSLPVDPPTNATRGTPESTIELVGGSYPFALQNTGEHDILPTKGLISTIREELKNRNWKFVRVLYQTNMASENSADGFPDLHPFKNVLLFVLPDDNGVITDVSVKGPVLRKAY